jgi:recombination protein RecA
MKTVEEVLAELDPKLRKRLSSGEGITFERQLTPSYGLNRALEGGLPYGRQVLIWGSKSSAKSSFCLQTIGIAQKEGKLCAWIDAEMSYDEKWARKLGVDPSKLIYSQARTISDMVEVSTKLINAGVDLIVVDSITSLLPSIYFEKDSEDLKALENTKQIGAEARDFSNAWKMINYANNKVKPTLFIIISQTRTKIGQMFSSNEPTGGQATKFYSSCIINLFSSAVDTKAIKGNISIGDKLIEQKIGRKVLWELQFSKTSAGFVDGEYDFYFKGDDIGVDSIGDLVNTAEALGLLNVKSGWYTLEDGTKLHGTPAMVQRVKEDLNFQEDLIKKVLSV